ncbi:MAG: UDP-N-acetylglucosamine 2-epimerase (non-hydrolyzing) [Betaproteobacteria bacterium]
MKIAPLSAAVAAHNRNRPGAPIRHVLVHSGQHYDPTLSSRFFRELGIPIPDYHLEVGSGSHAYQVGMTMIGFEKVLLVERPDWVIVVGDVNATSACSITAKKHQFRVAHIEAGLRSNDWSMPEEVNRVVTDRLSDVLFTTCRFANANLAREGVPSHKIAMVGNIMIDTLESQRAVAALRAPEEIVRMNRPTELAKISHTPLHQNEFCVLTLHRPSNVDDLVTLTRNFELFHELSETIPIVFPIHPRTAGRFKEFGLWTRLISSPRIIVVDPLGYLDLLALTIAARVFLTDSGGIQEECCVIGTPCLTLRANTERPATLVENGGTNHLVGTDPLKVKSAFRLVLQSSCNPHRPHLWDGQTATRILEQLLQRTDPV